LGLTISGGYRATFKLMINRPTRQGKGREHGKGGKRATRPFSKRERREGSVILEGPKDGRLITARTEGAGGHVSGHGKESQQRGGL